ncbi:MAG: ferredoxin family protein [Candidatus Odinarchaeota archaeon]
MPPKINTSLCDGSGTCQEVCPADPNVFEIVGGKAKVAHPEACIQCGACESSCPTGAITLE